jgi:hypothetical protein
VVVEAEDRLHRKAYAVVSLDDRLPLTIDSATYGLNCGAPAGNETSVVQQVCTGTSCSYEVDYRVIGDPVRGCQKDFRVAYHCRGGADKSAYAAPEAGYGSVVTMTCP